MARAWSRRTIGEVLIYRFLLSMGRVISVGGHLDPTHQEAVMEYVKRVCRGFGRGSKYAARETDPGLHPELAEVVRPG